jgi:hypothetical protein
MKLRLVIGLMGFVLAAPIAVGQSKGKSIEAKVVKRKASDKAVQATDKKVEKASMETAESAGSVGDKTVCSQGGLERHLELEWADTEKNAPCKVHYRKTSEDPNHHRVLWTADNDAAFCTEKAQEFVSKLEGWGWNCQVTAQN